MYFTFYKVSFFLLLFSLLGVCGTWGSVLKKTYREYEVFRDKKVHLEEEIHEKNLEVRSQEGYCRQIIDSPVFLEHVARKKLGYMKADEIIFHFDENTH